MKKAIAILLILVVVIGLCACDDGNIENKTPQEDPKTQMLSSAIEIEWGTLSKDYSENPLNAEDKYNGKIVTTTGYITEISTTHITLMPLAPSFKSEINRFIQRDIYLNREDLKQVKKDEIVTIVGTLSVSSNGIEIKEAYLVSNVVSITATVGEITLFDDSDGADYYYVPLTTTTISSGQAEFAQEFWYKLGATYPSEIIINGVSVKTGDKVNMEVTGKRNYEIFNKKGILGEYIFPMFVETVNSINIVG